MQSKSELFPKPQSDDGLPNRNWKTYLDCQALSLLGL